MTDTSTMGTHRNRWVYWVAIGLLAVFVVIGLATFRGARETQAANDKADEFLAVLADAGVDPLPSREQVARVLGDDGGATCEDPGDALAQATLYAQLTNGATGPGMRPVVADSRLVRGQLAVMSVYCPDQLEAAQAYLDDLTTDDVVKG
jgi:Tfp pilus assembly protein FimT